jgi:hypothetical protein
VSVVEEVKNVNGDLDKARGRIGDALHTLQDFYSHSNWIEMGKTEINALIGLNEKIGRVAEVNQSTCSSNGCTKIQSKCVSDRSNHVFSFRHPSSSFVF